MFTFRGLIEQKSKVFLFIAGRNLVSSDAEQVATVEDLQAGVCVRVCDGDNPLGNFVSLFLSNRTSSSVFCVFFLRESFPGEWLHIQGQCGCRAQRS